jgi:membrane protease YdiL (CAAX protease family)
MTPFPFHLDRTLNFIDLPPFLRAVQPKEHDWWRPPLTGALVVGGGFLFAVMGYGLAGSVNRHLIEALTPEAAAAPIGALFADPKLSMVDCQDCLMGGITKTVVLGGISMGFLLATLVFATLVNRRPALSWITAARTFRWRLFWAGVVLFSLVLGLVSAVPEALHGWPDRPVVFKAGETGAVRLTYALAMLTMLPVAAAAEEVFCRGWLMQTTAAFTPNLFAILVFNSVLFSLMHVDSDLGRNVARVILGMVFSYGALRLGGLEFGIGLHTANNLVILLLAETLPQTEHIAPSTTGGVLANLGVGLAALALIELVARWTPLRRLTGLEAYDATAETPT